MCMTVRPAILVIQMGKNSMKSLIQNIIVIGFVFWAGVLHAQSDVSKGTVSFLTSSNVYVRFVSTENIETGDTLTVNVEGQFKACLVVEQKSSSSCVCRKLEECKLVKGSEVFHRKMQDLTLPVLDIEENEDPSVQEQEVFDTDSLALRLQEYTQGAEEDIQSINARISASSYSSLDPEYEDRHRSMLRMSFNAHRINNSKFSVESYLNYRQNFDENSSNSSLGNRFLRVYNLNVNYQADSSFLISMGRKINRKMPSVGAIDGLQLDKSFGKMYAGAILGFRPDIVEFDFNPNLLEYGFYLGSDINSKSAWGQFTLGFLEQRNGSAIDRRYSYLQYSSTLYRNLSLFASAELDLYSFDNSVKSYSPDLTNIFVSARYRFSRRLSFSVSYDSRKRIIFYETLRTDLERLLADDEARQGIRARISFRPINLIYAGISYAKRFQSSTQNKSDNTNAFLSITRMPGIGGRLSFNYNLNKSNYLESQIMAARHSRSLVRGKLDLDMYYRHVSYNYFNTETQFKQYYIGAGLSWNVSRDLAFNLLVEQSQVGDRQRYRVNTKLIKRFRSK